MAQADPQHARIFEILLQKIEAHPRYGPGMRRAAGTGGRLALNYHSHGDPASFCVSICAVSANPLKIFGQEDELEELVHVKEFGPGEAECVPLCLGLGGAIQEHYLLADRPEIWLNGKPYPVTDEGGTAQ
ncbi:MAG TPA: hypothetical protein VGC54_14885 [Planctomycetota bacterium]